MVYIDYYESVISKTNNEWLGESVAFIKVGLHEFPTYNMINSGAKSRGAALRQGVQGDLLLYVNS